MNQLYTIFVKKKISFVGTKEELQLYQNGLGYPADVQRNLDALLESFKQYCESTSQCRHYLVSKIGDDLSAVFLWNENNTHKLYVMIYNKTNDTRAYSVNVKSATDLYNNEITQKIIKYLPRMCKFSETMLKNQNSKDVWMLDDLQRYADAIDKLGFDYDD